MVTLGAAELLVKSGGLDVNRTMPVLVAVMAAAAVVPLAAPASTRSHLQPAAAAVVDAAVKVRGALAGDGRRDGTFAVELPVDPSYTTTRPLPYSWIAHGLVAHGLGAVGGRRMTNSLEAFHESYWRGYRVFEVDLTFTSDSRLVAFRPDTDASAAVAANSAPARLGHTHSQFKSHRLEGGLTPLDVEDIAALMRAYPDVWFVTDTKDTSPRAARVAMGQLVDAMGDDRVLAHRIIVQIYNEEMLAAVRSVHPFDNVIYTIYQLRGTPEQAISFARERGVLVVAMPTVSCQPELVVQARRSGLTVAAHTVNNVELAARLRSMGVSVLYSDSLDPRSHP